MLINDLPDDLKQNPFWDNLIKELDNVMNNNVYILYGVIAILFIVILFVIFRTILNNNKQEIENIRMETKEIREALRNKKTVTEPKLVTLDILDRIIHTKLEYYLNQHNIIYTKLTDNEAKKIADKFTTDVILSLSEVFKSDVYTIYDENLFEVNIKQQFLNVIYKFDMKNTENNIPKGVIGD